MGTPVLFGLVGRVHRTLAPVAIMCGGLDSQVKTGLIAAGWLAADSRLSPRLPPHKAKPPARHAGGGSRLHRQRGGFSNYS